MVKDLLWALVLPNRRLPVFLYIGLHFILIIVTATVWHLLGAPGDTDPENNWGAWKAVYLLLLWMSFCVAANRMHDGGSTAMWFVPFYLLAAITFNFYLDPSIAGPDEDVQQSWADWFSIANRILRFGWCAVFGLAVKLQSEPGRNDYGMPFGEKDWSMGPLAGGRSAYDAGTTNGRRGGVARVAGSHLAKETPAQAQNEAPLVRRRRSGEFGRRPL